MTFIEKTFRADEQAFINIVNRYALYQMQPIPNSIDNYLDLIITTDSGLIEVFAPSPEDVFDRNSINHKAIEINVTFAAAEEKVIVERNYNRVRNKHVSNQLALIPAIEITDKRITLDINADESHINLLRDIFADTLKELLNRNSLTVKRV